MAAQCRYPARIRIVGLAAVATGIAGITSSIIRKAWAEQLPGALVAFVFYSAFTFYIWRGYEWARWVLFAFIALSGMMCLLFGLDQSSGTMVTHGYLLGAFALYLVAGIVIAWPVRRLSNQ
ncbi:MAG: hypothetical protein JWM57_3574 [Phycisphaerales bacterium]|nr:hypothetical protein [Phycisphaerales bacterium]